MSAKKKSAPTVGAAEGTRKKYHTSILAQKGGAVK